MSTRPANRQLVFFFVLLISLPGAWLNAQTQPGDTLKKLTPDTLGGFQDDSSLEEKITYEAADSTVALPNEGRALLYGKARVDYGSMNLESEFIEVDYTKNVVMAYGKKDSLGKNVGTPVFKDGSETMEAEKIMYNLKTRKGKIFNALTHQGELLVIGSEIKKDSTNVIHMKDMKCIPCQEQDARTIFRATKAKIIPNDKIITGPMYLEVGGVPTPLGLPFGYFPNTKRQKNGILLPTFGSSPNQGINLRQGGFYWGINDKTDLTLRGDVYANGSWALNLTNNYRVLYKASGFAYVSYSSFNIGDRDIPATFKTNKAYEIRWTHNQDNRNNPSVRFGANVNFVNNQTINRLLADNSGAFLQNTFLSNINYTKSFKFSALSLNASHNQNSQTGQMTITFPALTYNVNRFFPFKRENAVRQNVLDKIGVNYILLINNSLMGKDSTIFKGRVLDSLRYGVKQSLPVSTNFNLFKYITVTPGLNLNSYSYMSTNELRYYTDTLKTKSGENAGKDSLIVPRTRLVPVKGFAHAYEADFTTNMSTKVFFDFMYKRGKLSQIRYLLIPTLGYTYRPDFGDKKYGIWSSVQTNTNGDLRPYSVMEKGVFGGPLAGKQNALSINLNNNLEAKIRHRTDTGITYKKVVLLQNLGVSSAYNFAADSFKMSNILVTGRTVLFKNININASSTYDPYAFNYYRNARVDRFAVNRNGGLARFTSASISVNTSLSNNMAEAAKRLSKPPSMTNGAERGAQQAGTDTQGQPWNVSLGYNLLLTNNNAQRIQPSHQLSVVADLKPTKYWKMGITTGYDFTLQKLSYTRISVNRDLKCWEANISWVPFGVNKSYQFTMNLKTAMLSEFKIPRQRQWYDNF